MNRAKFPIDYQMEMKVTRFIMNDRSNIFGFILIKLSQHFYKRELKGTCSLMIDYLISFFLASIIYYYAQFQDSGRVIVLLYFRDIQL